MLSIYKNCASPFGHEYKTILQRVLCFLSTSLAVGNGVYTSFQYLRVLRSCFFINIIIHVVVFRVQLRLKLNEKRIAVRLFVKLSTFK